MFYIISPWINGSKPSAHRTPKTAATTIQKVIARRAGRRDPRALRASAIWTQLPRTGFADNGEHVRGVMLRCVLNGGDDERNAVSHH
jgi:hypothetical protein